MPEPYSEDVRLTAKIMWIVAGKTDPQIAQALGIPRHETIYDWRKKEGWQREREIYRAMESQRLQTAIGETTAQMTARHLEYFRLMQGKGAIGLAHINPAQLKPSESVELVVEGSKGERTARGLPNVIAAGLSLQQARALVETIQQIMAEEVSDATCLRRIHERFTRIDLEALGRVDGGAV